MTYRELNRRSNQLAHYLRMLGVGPEVLVGFCVERSVEMVVGILGILKAGGAYVPLDPAYPVERLAFMLEDAQVAVLLTQQRLLERLAAHPLPQGRVICLDADWESIAQESEQNLQSSVASENLAYVIYTSGSTGRPKGAMIRHRGLINYLTWCKLSLSGGRWAGHCGSLPDCIRPDGDRSVCTATSGPSCDAGERRAGHGRFKHSAEPGTRFEPDQDNAIALALTRPATNAGASGGADSSLHHRRGEPVARAHRLLAKSTRRKQR